MESYNTHITHSDSPSAVAAGYTFVGWREQYTDGTLGEIITGYVTINTSLGGDRTFCEVWQTIRHEITYELNATDAVNDPKNPDHYYEGVIIDLSEPYRTGYTFEGWYLNPDLEQDRRWRVGLPADKTNLVLYAKWEEIIIIVQVPTQLTWTYDGKLHGLDYLDEYCSVKEGHSDHYDAGDYSTTFTLKSGHKWSDHELDDEDQYRTRTFDWSIQKRDLFVVAKTGNITVGSTWSADDAYHTIGLSDGAKLRPEQYFIIETELVLGSNVIQPMEDPNNPGNYIYAKADGTGLDAGVYQHRLLIGEESTSLRNYNITLIHGSLVVRGLEMATYEAVVKDIVETITIDLNEVTHIGDAIPIIVKKGDQTMTEGITAYYTDSEGDHQLTVTAAKIKFDVAGEYHVTVSYDKVTVTQTILVQDYNQGGN